MIGLMVAVCTSRLEDLRSRWQHNLARLEPGEFLALLDMPVTPEVSEVMTDIVRAGGQVICHGAQRGLSAARNSVLDALPAHRIVFIDDDVRLDRPAVEGIRAAFTAGAHVVGARLVPPDGLRPWPWYLTDGQMHLLTWHSDRAVVKTWGACMGIDAAFAHEHGLRFDERLGRTGRRLESGDDTSFISAMKAAGAHEILLPDVRVVHEVHEHRLRLRYLVRRCYWQGRSEVRRRQPIAGLHKEWQRHRAGDRGLILAAGYSIAFVAGVIRESAGGLRAIVGSLRFGLAASVLRSAVMRPGSGGRGSRCASRS